MRPQLVPNAVFHYDISPVMVVVHEETMGFASFVTKICAVIGGIYTVRARPARLIRGRIFWIDLLHLVIM